MLKYLLTFALLCASVQAVWDTVTARTANAFSVSINSDLYTLSVRNTSTLKLYSTNENFSPCIFDVNVATPHAMRAIVLGNSQKIVAWQNPHEDKSKFNHTVLLIDPWTCEGQLVPLPEDETPENGNVRVVAYDDSFYVFFPSRRACWPCRFDDNAEIIPLEHQMGSEDQPPFSFFIEPLDASTPERGYLYVHVFEDLTSVVKILDADFKVLKQVFVDYTVNAVATKYQNDNQTIVICHSTPDGSQAPDDYDETWEQTTSCDRLNTDLQTISTSILDTPDSHFIAWPRHVTLQIDDQDTLHFGALMVSKRGGYNILRYVRSDPNEDSQGRTMMTYRSLGCQWLVHSYLEGDTMTLIADETVICFGNEKNTAAVAKIDVTEEL